jgi:hypothetical protein
MQHDSVRVPPLLHRSLQQLYYSALLLSTCFYSVLGIRFGCHKRVNSELTRIENFYFHFLLSPFAFVDMDTGMPCDKLKCEILHLFPLLFSRVQFHSWRKTFRFPAEACCVCWVLFIRDVGEFGAMNEDTCQSHYGLKWPEPKRLTRLSPICFL